MPRILEPCPTCSRHVAVSETECPMCGAHLGAAWSPPARPSAAPPHAHRRSGRAVRFAWRLFLATTTTACGARTSLEQPDGAAADGGRSEPDAALAVDAGRDGRDAGPAEDAGEDAGIDAGDIAIYGAPPMREPPRTGDALPPPRPARVRRRRRSV